MMKQIFSGTALMVALLGFIAAGTQGWAAPALQVGTLTLPQGGEGVLTLSLTGATDTETFAGVNAKVVLPPGVGFKNATEGAQLPVGAFTLDYSATPAGANTVVTVIAYSGANTFQGNGVLLNLNLSVASNAPTGTSIPIPIGTDSGILNARYALSDATGKSLSLPVPQNGSITINSGVITDTDGDGLPDDWEMEHFGTLDWGPNDDPDGDGVNNGTEYQNGTPPDLFVGDVNNDKQVNLSDALLILRYYYNDSAVDMPNIDAAYVNADGLINLSDALLVLRRYYNEIGSLGKPLDEKSETTLMQNLVGTILQNETN